MSIFNNLNSIKKIHFVGIGGIGISGLAKLMILEGKEISGSDLVCSEIIQDLERKGGQIFIAPHQAFNLKEGIELVITNPAIPKDNPEVLEAKKKNIPIKVWNEIVGEVMKNKLGICISGMHGKTTTTALIGLILEKGGLDPTVIVGGQVKDFQGNARLGQSQYLVLEADEYAKSFLYYYPKMIVLTRIELDHLDTYKNLKDILKTFSAYIQKLPPDGLLIANADDENIMKIVNKTKARVITYGLEKGDFQAQEIIQNQTETQFQVRVDNNLVQFKLPIPGLHNVYNALASLIVGLKLRIEIETIKEVLADFSGVSRRFEEVGFFREIPIISDYAHHPTEIKNLLEAIKIRYPHKRLVMAYQPHQHNRTKKLFKDFIPSFDKADLIILSEIFEVAGREETIDQDISSQDLAQEISKRGKSVFYARNLGETKRLILDKIKSGDVLLIVGAGDIYLLVKELVGN